jgi:hypothetical protein
MAICFKQSRVLEALLLVRLQTCARASHSIASYRRTVRQRHPHIPGYARTLNMPVENTDLTSMHSLQH